MIWFTAFVVLRLGAAACFLLTAAYGIVCYSPFAFDMFIRPQLLPWVNQFVAWHHAWYGAAYAASVWTLGPELDPRIARHGMRRVAHRLAVAYVLAFGMVAVWLVQWPYLAALGNDSRSLVAGIIAFVPLAWLGVIDHLAAWPASRAGLAPPPGSRRLLTCCAACAGYIWVTHVARAARLGTGDGPAIAWVVTGTWVLVLTSTVFAVLYAALELIGAIAARVPVARRWGCAYGLTAAMAAGVTAEFLRRLLFPAIAFEGSAAAGVAAIAGASLTAAGLGLAIRKPRASEPVVPAAIDVMFGSISPRALALAGLLGLPFASSSALEAAEQIDWMFVIQRVILGAESIAAFAMMLSLTKAVRGRTPLPWAAPAVAALTIAGLWAVPRAAAVAARWTENYAVHHALATERYAAAEPSFKLMASAIVRWPGHDASYYRYLQTQGANTSVAIPDVSLTTRFAESSHRRPDIFVFVIDSLRRDYLSPYNASVTFTPQIERFAKESFVFRNAFTRHGGTALSMPALWAGGFMVRRDTAFKRMNAIEKLLDAEGYRIAINDFTVADLLETRATFINPGVPSPDTDLCQNIEGLRAYLENSATDPTPIFGYFAPMNVHIINTRRAGQPTAADAEYPGFYAPYASRLRRIDGCFGSFVSYLEAHRRYDDAIVILTSDHGDSLGEGRRWGHTFWLFPEDIRVPLIVRLPSDIAGAVTTDLERIAFTTDIAPTLYALLGHPLRDLGPLFGSPLFADPDAELTPRRRESFLITSSYAATYGLLRRNGRSLYITDLFERKEFAFDLRPEPIGKPIAIDHELRGLNQRLIRERVAEVGRFYQVKPQ